MKRILAGKSFGLSIRRTGWLGLVVMLVMFVPAYGQETTEPDSPASSADREELGHVTERLTISIGQESLYYKQREPETATTSHASVTNSVLNVRWLEQWECFIDGIKAVIPISIGDDREVRNSYGKHPYRTNDFSYKWTRIDGYIGYSLFEESRHIVPVMTYAGLRWSKAEQSRENFIVLGNPQAGSAKVKIKSWGLLIGFFIGNEMFKPDYSWVFGEVEPKAHTDWLWYWGLECNLPLSVKVTDSALPGVKFKKKTGYTLETRGGVGWLIGESLSFEVNIYAGVMQWKGSNWKNTSYGLVKWPENKTDYIGADLGLTLRF